MAKFRPFHGILPAKALAQKVVSRPFDNYSKEQVQEILTNNPYSFLHIISPVIPSDDEQHIPYEEKLALGKQAFQERMDNHTFVQDTQRYYYVYRQINDGEQYLGIIGAISIDDCIRNIVKPHEQTIEHKEEKLKEYLKIIDINAEPVVISYKADYDINDLMDKIVLAAPDLKMDVQGFGSHELWKIGDAETVRFIEERFEAMDELYICDGHHRTASSVLYGQEMRSEHPEYSGEESFNYFMVILFPHHQIRLREFNRLVKDLNGMSVPQLIQKISSRFTVVPTIDFPDTSEELFSYGMYVEKQWYQLIPIEGEIEKIPEENQLPTQVLTDMVLSPVLDIHDLRRDKRIHFIGGKTDPELLMKLVDSGKYKIAFTVNKISIPLFKKFADNGWFMPPKSTWFEPKLLNGLVVYSLEGDL